MHKGCGLLNKADSEFQPQLKENSLPRINEYKYALR